VKTVFCDTVYFLALLNPADSLHEAAKSYIGDAERALLTTQWVLAEVGNALSRQQGRNRFAQLLDILNRSPHTEVIPADAKGFRSACELFVLRPDKEWSLTDCHSFLVMKERGLEEALTHDHHFKQAGFRILL